MEILLVLVALVLIVGAGVLTYHNKKWQTSLLEYVKELQENPEVQAAQKKIVANAKAKVTEEIVKEAKKVTKKK